MCQDELRFKSTHFDGCSQWIIPTRTWIQYSLDAVVLLQSKNTLHVANSGFEAMLLFDQFPEKTSVVTQYDV